MADLAVHVTPRSGRDEVCGWRGTELAVRVTVAPEGGKANAAVCVVVAKALGIAEVVGTGGPRRDVASQDASDRRRR